VALFGAGWQAQSQLEGLAHVLPGLTCVEVVGRDPERVQRFCAAMSDRLAVDVRACASGERAVADADVVVTATGSTHPLFDGSRLRVGTHINAVGSNYPDKQEIDALTVERADRVVVDDIAVARTESGDLIAAAATGRFDWQRALALCDVVSGSACGRSSADEITLFESHGLGIEDLAVAACAIERARSEGVGSEIAIG
jgi:ornithine cyclodeaminase/alanine dehydrogenase-like protein (mu-crystallin family)